MNGKNLFILVLAHFDQNKWMIVLTRDHSERRLLYLNFSWLLHFYKLFFDLHYPLHLYIIAGNGIFFGTLSWNSVNLASSFYNSRYFYRFETCKYFSDFERRYKNWWFWNGGDSIWYPEGRACVSAGNAILYESRTFITETVLSKLRCVVIGLCYVRSKWIFYPKF